MSGQFIQICSKRPFESSSLGQGQTQITTVAERVPVGDFREMALIVRVHDKTIAAQNGSLVVYALHELPSSEEPQAYFVGPTASPACSATIDSANPAASPLPSGNTQYALATASSTSFGAFVRVVIVATGGVGGGPKANLSIALQLKS